MSPATKSSSTRFKPSRWTRWLVPVVLGLLLLGLVATLVIIGLSLAGLTPGI